jgi:hypothetical protein
MEHLIQLNLHNDGKNAETATSPKRERREPESPVISRRLNRIGNKAAHKAAKEFARTGSGIFSK